MKSQPLRLLVNSRKAAEALDISERHLWQLEDRGHLTAIKLGRSKKYSISELERFVADQYKRAGAADKRLDPFDSAAINSKVKNDVLP